MSLFIAGCTFPGKPDPKERPLPAEWVTNFDKLFTTHCQGCHGADGKLGPAPPLNDPLFRALIPEAELEKVLLHGRPGTPMPAFAVSGGGPLTPAQVRVLIYEIKGIPYRIIGKASATTQPTVMADSGGSAPKWGIPQAAPADTPPYVAPAGSMGDRESGKTTFAAACGSCHGKDGTGGKKAGAINNRAFLTLISDQALRRIIITGRDDLKMPGCADQGLTAADVADLGALLRSWRHSD